MRILNTSGWRKRWLAKVVQFCCEELDCPVDTVKEATFRLTSRVPYCGKADLMAGSISVGINPRNAYPFREPRRYGTPELVQSDAVEVLVNITAHEIAHVVRWDRFVRDLRRSGKRDIGGELETEHMSRMVLAIFRHDRECLLDLWGEAGRGPIRSTAIDKAARSGVGVGAVAAATSRNGNGQRERRGHLKFFSCSFEIVTSPPPYQGDFE